MRGAPAIGVTGALSLAADLVTNKQAGGAFASVAEAQAYIVETLDYLVTRCVSVLLVGRGEGHSTASSRSA